MARTIRDTLISARELTATAGPFVLLAVALLFAAYASTTYLGVDADSTWLACLPLHHIGGFSVITRALLCGTGLVVHPSFDAADVELTVFHGRGGAIGLVEEGDVIEIDIPNRRIHLAVSEADLASRREAQNARGWKPANRVRHVSAALQAYAALTTSADTGAVRDVTQIQS